MIFFRRLFAWLRGDSPQYVSHWTPEVARKHERQTLRMLGRGETAYVWAAKVRTQSKLRKPVLRMPKRNVG